MCDFKSGTLQLAVALQMNTKEPLAGGRRDKDKEDSAPTQHAQQNNLFLEW